jgi:restriction system protein
MGHIWMPSETFVRSLSEDAGCRSGFALGEDDILGHLGADHQFVEEITSREIVRLASNDYADAVGDLLFALGAARTPGMPPLTKRFLWKLDQGLSEVFDIFRLMEIEAVGTEYARRLLAKDSSQNDVLEELRRLLGDHEETCLPGLLAAIDEEIGVNPFYVRETSKSDLIALGDLFQSETLPSDDDRFFDQRFVDYLDRNPEALLKMNWRQFEGLAAEWFQRQGYSVEIGPGRNDGGVDLRLWKDDLSQSGPPTVIVQCKRHKEKVDRVTVKALYSDLLFENATGAMVVTTSDISRGANKDIQAREYPITTANLEAVTSWLSEMRTPGNGFLGFDDPLPDQSAEQ